MKSKDLTEAQIKNTKAVKHLMKTNPGWNSVKIFTELHSIGYYVSRPKIRQIKNAAQEQIDRESIMVPKVVAALTGWIDTSPDRVQDWAIFDEVMKKNDTRKKMPWEN